MSGARSRFASVSAGVALAIALAMFAALAPRPAEAHHGGCVVADKATFGAGPDENVFAAFSPLDPACRMQYDDVEPVIERDFDVEGGAVAARASSGGEASSTFAKCKDGMAADTFPCDRIDMLSHVSHAELGTTFVNDMWGWTDPRTRKDFALVGASEGTVFVDISNPKRPRVQGILPTASTAGGAFWRDLKVYKNHVFVVSEHTNHGVQVFDLTRLRHWDGTYNTYTADARYTQHGSAHNVHINEKTGYLYSVGAGPFSTQSQPNTVIVDPPSPAAGSYLASGAEFGPPPAMDALTGDLALVDDGSSNPSHGCGELAGFPGGAIAIADRGSCPFAQKALNAQNAGAVALVVVNNVAGAPATMSGTDPAVEIPSVMVSLDDGTLIKNGLPTSGGVLANDPPPVCGTGLHIIDIRNPENPKFAGCFDGHGYVHDTQCIVHRGYPWKLHGHELCFNSNATSTQPGGEHRVAVVDVTDKSNPVPLSREAYPEEGYSHQGWLTPDRRFFLHGDELDEQRRGIRTTTRVWDVRDPRNPELIHVFENATTSIDHNVYTEGRYAYASNYTSGLRVYDTSGLPRRNLTESAFFDLYPENDNPSFEGGTWSNYGFFREKGVVAASSIDRGLFILRPKLSHRGSR
jgi:PA domain/LVIVD repeat